MADREKTPKAGPTVKVTTYLPPGVRPDPYEGNEPSLDPDLEQAREDEAKKLEDVHVFDERDREDPSIDPELVAIREREQKTGARVIGALLDEGDKSAEAAADADPQPAKKAAAKKSSK